MSDDYLSQPLSIGGKSGDNTPAIVFTCIMLLVYCIITSSQCQFYSSIVCFLVFSIQNLRRSEVVSQICHRYRHTWTMTRVYCNKQSPNSYFPKVHPNSVAVSNWLSHKSAQQWWWVISACSNYLPFGSWHNLYLFTIRLVLLLVELSVCTMASERQHWPAKQATCGAHSKFTCHTALLVFTWIYLTPLIFIR